MARRAQPATLSGNEYEGTEVEIKLSGKLMGNMRSLTLRPEGNLLEYRFKSLQKRSVIETRVRP